MDDVVLRAVSREMAKHTESEENWRRDPASALGVKTHTGGDRDHAHSREVGRIGSVPLTEREVSDVVAVRGQPKREVAIPTLGASDSVPVEAVVDDAACH